MLGLYLYTLIIGKQSCNMLSIVFYILIIGWKSRNMLSIVLKKLTLELQNVVTNNVFLDNKLKYNNNKTKNQS